MAPRITLARKSDLPRLVALFTVFLPTDFVLRRFSATRPLEEQVAHYGTLLQGPGSLTLVAQEGRQVVGLVLTAKARPGIRRLVAVWVNPQRRGEGLGQALVLAAAELAATRGEDIFLSTWSRNVAATHCYKNAGFRLVATVPDHREDGDATLLYVRYGGGTPAEYW